MTLLANSMLKTILKSLNLGLNYVPRIMLYPFI